MTERTGADRRSGARLALDRLPAEPARAALAALEQRLESRERALDAARGELQHLQSRYLDAVGVYYRELVELDAEMLALEIRLGLRAPADAESDDADDPATRADDGDGCGNRGAPSTDLKKMFRNLAKTLHPDLAIDEPARWRRHSLMAEANRAYAERDEDRLRLILHTWERSPEAIVGDDAGSEAERLRRRTAELEARLVAIEREFADLRDSAIGRLKIKIDEARAKGWDLMAEMVAEVKRDVGRARARIASLRRVTQR
jgi:hypothetical protein